MKIKNHKELLQGVHRTGEKSMRIVIDSFSFVIPKGFVMSFDPEYIEASQSRFFVAMTDNGDEPDFYDPYSVDGDAIVIPSVNELDSPRNMQDKENKTAFRDTVDKMGNMMAGFMGHKYNGHIDYKSDETIDIIYTQSIVNEDEGAQLGFHFVTKHHMVFGANFITSNVDKNCQTKKLSEFLDSIQIIEDYEPKIIPTIKINTGDKSLIISSANSFSVEIPQGFIIEQPEGMEDTGYYFRAIADDGKSSFEKFSDASKSFVFEGNRVINRFDSDIRNPDMEEALDDFIEEFRSDEKIIEVVSCPDLIIKYYVYKDEDDDSCLIYRCFIGFMCRLTHCAFYFNDDNLNKSECKKIAESVLKTIKAIHIDEKMTLVDPEKSIIHDKKKYTLSFKLKNRIKFGDWSMIIPDDFICKADNIGLNQVIAFFDDGSADADDIANTLGGATISLLVTKNVNSNGHDFDLTESRVKIVLAEAMVENNLIQDDSDKAMFANTSSYFIFYQRCTNQSFNGMIYKTVIITKSGMYMIQVGINLKSNEFTFNHKEYEAYLLQMLSTIEVAGEKVKPFKADENALKSNSVTNIKAGSIIEFSSYKWRVLDADDDAKILVISEDILEMRPYHSSKTDVTWETCDLRKYLNGEFLNKLNKEKIITVDNRNPLNLFTQTDGGNDTKDSVFVPGLLEVAMYFGKKSGIFDGFHRGEGNGKSISTGRMTLFISEDENSKRIARDSNGKSCEWWLRTPGGQKDYAVVISDEGEIQMRGSSVTSGGNIGVRPALWLSRDALDENNIAPTPTSSKPIPAKKRNNNLPAENTDDDASSQTDISFNVLTDDFIQPDVVEETISPEDLKVIQEEVMPAINNIQSQLSDASAGMSKFGDFLQLQEERKTEEEKENARKKAEALATGKSEKDIVNMFITLTNEKIMGQLNRSDADFFETYQEDFAAFKKADLLKTRKQILSELEDESLALYYGDKFKGFPLDDRIAMSTQNLSNVMSFDIIPNEYDLGKRADYAIEQTRQWYTDEELPKVRKQLRDELAKNRSYMDEQIKQMNEEWTKFNTARSSIQIIISEKGADKIDKDDPFVIDCGNTVATVGIYTSGIFRMGFNLMNSNPWYWDVSVMEIWDVAIKNEVRDNRDYGVDGEQIARQAYNQAVKKYAVKKVEETTKVQTKQPISGQQTATTQQQGQRPATPVQPKAQQLTSEQQRAQQSALWQQQGLCRYCGSKIGGLFSKKCKSCGKSYTMK